MIPTRYSLYPATIEELHNVRRGLERLLRYGEKREDEVVIDWALHLLNALERIGINDRHN